MTIRKELEALHIHKQNLEHKIKLYDAIKDKYGENVNVEQHRRCTLIFSDDKNINYTFHKTEFNHEWNGSEYVNKKQLLLFIEETFLNENVKVYYNKIDLYSYKQPPYYNRNKEQTKILIHDYSIINDINCKRKKFLIKKIETQITNELVKMSNIELLKTSYNYDKFKKVQVLT